MQFAKRKILKFILQKIKKTDVELKLAIAVSFVLLLSFVGMIFLKYFLINGPKLSLSYSWKSAATVKKCQKLATPSSIAPIISSARAFAKRNQIEFCEGNACAAGLLNFVDKFHAIKLKLRKTNQRPNDIDELLTANDIRELLIEVETNQALCEQWVALLSSSNHGPESSGLEEAILTLQQRNEHCLKVPKRLRQKREAATKRPGELKRKGEHRVRI